MVEALLFSLSSNSSFLKSFFHDFIFKVYKIFPARYWWQLFIHFLIVRCYLDLNNDKNLITLRELLHNIVLVIATSMLIRHSFTNGIPFACKLKKQIKSHEGKWNYVLMKLIEVVWILLFLLLIAISSLIFFCWVILGEAQNYSLILHFSTCIFRMMDFSE